MSNSKLFELEMPKFLLAIEPTQMPSGFHYIYSPHYLSLVLVIRERTQQVILNNELRNKPQKRYTYNDNEQFTLVVLQDNVDSTGGILSPKISQAQFLDEAWEWYSTNMITQEI